MATFTVNGKSVTVEKNQKLIRFLRDELHLTSVKDGCSEGACGTCHVLIDGKPTKACIPQTDKLEGKTILTVEGLSDWEKQVYTFAFGEAGAVQCGFCIPGMVISAKGLLDVNPDPTREEAAFAIRNNICRCTGYVKIIDGILLAAKIFREGKLPAPSADDWQMGSRVHRLDVEEKVLGYGQYPDDIYVDGMCYGGAVRSQYARARVLSIDTSEAEALPGVICVATQKDIPGKVNVGHLKKDQPTLIGVGELVHYLGDSVALVCAVDQETVEAAKKLVKVEYEAMKGTSLEVTLPIRLMPPIRIRAMMIASATPMIRLTSFTASAGSALKLLRAESMAVVIVLTCVALPVPNTASTPKAAKKYARKCHFLSSPFLI